MVASHGLWCRTLTAGAVMTLGAGAWAQPAAYVLNRAGLYGPEFTSASGTRNVSPLRLSLVGDLAGRSERFNGGATSQGFAAWLYRDGSTQRIGYFDSLHTSLSLSQTSAVIAINPQGTVIGTSTRYTEFDTGLSAWRVADGLMARLGYTTPEFTRLSGNQSSNVVAINASGRVLGYSVRYPETAEFPLAAWTWHNSVYTPVGLMDAEHTSANGYNSATPVALNDAGDAAGTSIRYQGAASMGNSAWLCRAGVTTRAGFFDAEHTDGNGRQNSSVTALSANGRVAGKSDRYVTPGFVTSSAWIHDGVMTTRIGLFDGVHATPDGQQLSEVRAISGNGNVIGRSFRYSGNFVNGESAWIYTGGVSSRIGLTGPGYVTSTGFEYSQALQVNDRAEVLGQSTMKSETINGGSAVWVYRAGQTVRVGLFDARHTNPDSGFQNSVPLRLNARGDAIGTSARYTLPFVNDMGWYYDRATDTTVALVFSTNSAGEARTTPTVLTDDGVVYGSYLKYNGETVVGTFIFRWTLAGGMQELAPLVQGGLAGAGWQQITSVSSATVPGTFDGTTVVGSGRLIGETVSSVYALKGAPTCGTADFDCDGDTGTDADIEAFFRCIAGACPASPCGRTADFDGDGDTATDADIEAFFRVLAGGTC